MAREGHTN